MRLSLRQIRTLVAVCGLMAVSQAATAGTITAVFTSSSPVPAGCGPADVTGRCTNSLDHSRFLGGGVEELTFETPNLVLISGNTPIAVPATLTASGGTVVSFTPSDGGASIQPGQLHSDTVSIAAAPWNDYTQFLSVPSSLAGSSGAVQLSFGGRALNYLGFDWGSIDTYNSVSFLSGSTVLRTFTGSDVVGFDANGAQMSDRSNGYVDFFLSGMTFDSVILASSNRAFEIDNLAFGNAVPAPGSLALIGLGLIGLARLRRKVAAA
jgi:hypothetical protein